MPTETQELSLVGKDEGPQDDDLVKRADLPAIFSPFKASINALLTTAKTIKVTSADDVTMMRLARETRLELRKNRIAIEHKEEELKTGLNKLKKSIKEKADEYYALIQPEEDRLWDEEKLAERLEAERKAKLVEERAAALLKYEVPSAYMALGEMPQETFDQLLENSRAAFEAKKAETLRLEQERIAAENARLIREKEEAAERERVKAENARLKAEAEERERKAAEERVAAEKEAARLKKIADDAEAARKAQEARAAREKQEAEEKAAAELRAQQEEAKRKEEEAEAKHKADLQKVADEVARLAEKAKQAAALKARKEREAAEAAAQDERDKAARELAAANRAKEEAQKASEAAQMAEARRLAVEAKAKADAEAAAQEAAKAPDREKLTIYADALLAVPLPALNTEAGNLCLQRVEREVKALAEFILKKAGAM